MLKNLTIGALAYLVPTFALGFVWHLVLFASYYAKLAMYRADILIPFGFASMVIQGFIFSWIYNRALSSGSGSAVRRAVNYALLGATLSWSFTTLAVAAKNVMTSVPDYLLIETAFTGTQWLMVAPLTAALVRRT